MTKYLRAFALFLATLSLVGCASVPMGSLEDDIKAKQFVPTPETASLYIYRNENFGGAVPMTVNVNNQSIGQTGPMTYFHLSVVPGMYNIESVAENTSSVSISVEPSKNYFVWQEVKMGVWMARTQLNRVDETVGRKGVTESKILAAKLPGSKIQPIAVGGAAVVPAPASNSTTAEKLRQLQKMRDEKLISPEEYDAKRKEILNGF